MINLEKYLKPDPEYPRIRQVRKDTYTELQAVLALAGCTKASNEHWYAPLGTSIIGFTSLIYYPFSSYDLKTQKESCYLLLDTKILNDETLWPTLSFTVTNNLP